MKWEVEQKQLRERHVMSKNQLKEMFFLQRSQMLNRHEKVNAVLSLFDGHVDFDMFSFFSHNIGNGTAPEFGKNEGRRTKTAY